MSCVMMSMVCTKMAGLLAAQNAHVVCVCCFVGRCAGVRWHDWRKLEADSSCGCVVLMQQHVHLAAAYMGLQSVV